MLKIFLEMIDFQKLINYRLNDIWNFLKQKYRWYMTSYIFLFFFCKSSWNYKSLKLAQYNYSPTSIDQFSAKRFQEKFKLTGKLECFFEIIYKEISRLYKKLFEIISRILCKRTNFYRYFLITWGLNEMTKMIYCKEAFALICPELLYG